MKKTLIAIALTALPVASMAEVTLYGQIRGGIETVKVQNSGGTTTQIVDYGSRIGFKGKEQISDNLKAIWQLEQSVNIGGKQTGFGTRNSFVGLETSAGTVKAGYLLSPVGELQGTVNEYQASSKFAKLGLLGESGHTGRKIAVSYETPEMNGFKATAYVSPSENNNGETTSVTGQTKPDAAFYSVGAEYKHASGAFVKGAGSYQHVSGRKANGDRYIPYHGVVVGGYDANNIYAGVEYHQTRNAASMHGDRTQEVAATVAYTFDNALRLKGSAAYGFNLKNDDGSKSYGNGKYLQSVVGADYKLSKRTDINAQVGYTQLGRKELKQRAAATSIGLRHKF